MKKKNFEKILLVMFALMQAVMRALMLAMMTTGLIDLKNVLPFNRISKFVSLLTPHIPNIDLKTGQISTKSQSSLLTKNRISASIYAYFVALPSSGLSYSLFSISKFFMTSPA